MGLFLIIRDKIFASFQPELPASQYQPIKYGLTKPLEKEDPVHIVVHKWKNIGKDIRKKGLTFEQRWNYLFGPPDWSHDGSRHTSDELRCIEKEMNNPQ